MSLHAEMPSSKAKREQALRNILAARRRQILSQRSHEPPRILSGRAPRPSDERRSKDPPDILETQETRHNVYVTSARTEAPTEEETSQSPKKLIDKVAAASDLGPTKPEVEAQTPKTPKDDNSSSSSSSPSSPTTSTTITTESYAESVLSTSASAGAKPNDADARRKNTVSMPESLYNHFRPVESNIPVEDMSQFLYFGQKLPADGGPSNNVTGVNGGNNSSNFVETTSAVPSSHRRYSAKRLSALAPGPVEEIVNEEMNIALERRIVEKNQVSRIKNTFRSPGSGLYYRKARPADLVSNMIPGNESSSTLAGPDPRGEINTVDTFRADPSAHADRPREQATRQRGSDAHVVEPSTTTTTQIPRQRQLPGVSDDADVDDGLAKSDIDVKSADLTTVASREEVVESKRKRTGDLEKNVGELGTELKSKGAEVEEEANGTKAEMKTAEKSERKVTTDADVTTATTPRSNARSRDSNSDETSTSSTTADAQTTLPSLFQRAESSTLRIVVPDESFGRSFAIESERTRQDTVKQPVDPAAADRPVRVSAAGDDVAPKSLSTPSTTDSAAAPAVVADTGHRQPHHQQQHVYAYTITNVTRLLRNYTGSSGEERAGGDGGETGGGRRSSGAEITSGGPSQRRQQQQQQQSQLQSPLLRPPPSSSSSPLLLPRAGDGIEPARALAGLSAGATIEPAAAAEASSNATAVGLVGERARKVVPQVQQQQQRATSQRATWPAHLGASDSVVISPTRPVKSTEARGFVRWSQVAKSRTSDQEGANDRRFLRKSASAVLNQRSTVHEETASSAPLTSKRRHVLAPQSGLVSPGGRRVKSNDRERSEAARGRVLVTDDRSSGTSRGKSSDDEVSGAAPLREAARVSGLMNEVPRDSSAQETTVTVANTGVTTTVTATTAMVNSSRDEAMDAPADPLTLMDATTTTEADKADVRKEEDVVTASSAGDGAARIGGDATLEQTESDVNETSGEVATTATVTEQVGDTTTTMITTTPSSQTSMMATLTTTAAPVFPVTPRILAEADKTTVREASGPSDDAKPPEANNRPFGSAADLDPTEIQKRYRAKESSTTTTATTITATPTTVSPVRSDASSLPNGGPEAAGASTPALKESGRRVSGERSPEVRARNLSDKSKDKDEDVLPIMHLYNTSDIFNGSGPMEGFARGTDRPRLVLPMGSDANPPAATTTTTKPPGATRKSASEPVEIGSVDGSASTTVPIPKAWEPTASPSGSRKDKQEENRGEASQDTNGAPTASRGASSFAPASGSNRTRYRPSYHPSLLPEYNNGTMYPVGLNRTFLEIGPISVSPRESMNISEVISKPHDGDVIATQETVAVVSYILATLVVFPIAVGVGLILRRLILRNRKVSVRGFEVAPPRLAPHPVVPADRPTNRPTGRRSGLESMRIAGGPIRDARALCPDISYFSFARRRARSRTRSDSAPECRRRDRVFAMTRGREFSGCNSTTRSFRSYFGRISVGVRWISRPRRGLL